MWRTREVIHTTAHHNNQHYREQYTDQANKDRMAPGPVYQPGHAVWCQIHERIGNNPKQQPMWEEGEIISNGSNPNSYKVRKIARARKGQMTINIQDLQPCTPTPNDPPGLPQRRADVRR
jgi:hypothetical protein